MATRTKVFITMPTKSLVQSTDRGYLYGRLTRMAERYPVTFVPNDAALSRAYDDGRAVLVRGANLVGAPFFQREHAWSLVRVPPDVDVAYAYGQFPWWPRLPHATPDARPGVPPGVPIVWQQTFAPVELGTDYAAWRRALIAARREPVARAARIVVPSEVSRQHVVEIFPAAAHKVSVLPYYMPGLEPLPDPDLAQKLADPGPTRVLFVGKQAQRKGLPELIRAFAALTPETRAKLEVTVVSAFVDGPVPLPEGWRHARFVDDLYAAMGAAHVLAFPTLREAYGLVLVEGMARGTAILTTSAPLQRDIVGEDGGAFAAPTDTAAMARALTELAHDRARVAAMARANVARFRQAYWHEVVGPAHLHVFEDARRR